MRAPNPGDPSTKVTALESTDLRASRGVDCPDCLLSVGTALACPGVRGLCPLRAKLHRCKKRRPLS
jgi:hypothetical protein